MKQNTQFAIRFINPINQSTHNTTITHTQKHLTKTKTKTNSHFFFFSSIAHKQQLTSTKEKKQTLPPFQTQAQNKPTPINQNKSQKYTNCQSHPSFDQTHKHCHQQQHTLVCLKPTNCIKHNINTHRV